MAKIQLAAVCTFLFAFLPCQALDCLSKCCSKDDVDRAGKLLVSAGLPQTTGPSPSQPLPATVAKECWASSEGNEHGLRSVSPWRYRLDSVPDRYPQDLRQAYCSCNRCISLHGSRRNYTTLAVSGNSVPIQFNTTVFWRKPCSGAANRYRLKPDLYLVTVSCACLATRRDR